MSGSHHYHLGDKDLAPKRLCDNTTTFHRHCQDYPKIRMHVPRRIKLMVVNRLPLCMLRRLTGHRLHHQAPPRALRHLRMERPQGRTRWVDIRLRDRYRAYHPRKTSPTISSKDGI